MREAMDTYQELFTTPEGELTDDLKHCRAYVEDVKVQKHEHRISNNKMKNITDVIRNICETQDIYNQTEWEQRVEYAVKIQLMQEYGLNVDSYVQRIVRLRRQERTNRLKDTSITEMMIITMENYMKDNDHADDTFLACVEWLMTLFEENDIDVIDFMAWNEIIKTQRYTKINAVVLQGPTNAGKSLIIQEFLGQFHLEEICRERDNSGFHLDQLPFSVGVLFEEPCITPTNVGTWKLLFEGKVVKTDIKHKDKEGIPRIPIWCTTASKITANIDPNESSQIYQRIKLYVFKRTIQHRRDHYTKPGLQNYGYLDRAPGNIGPEQFAFIYLLNWDRIRDKIYKEDESHTISNAFDYNAENQTIYEAINNRGSETRGTRPGHSRQDTRHRTGNNTTGEINDGYRETDSYSSTSQEKEVGSNSNSTSSSLNILAAQWQTALQAVWTTTTARTPALPNEANALLREEVGALVEGLEDL